jgi:hypothetical protein
VGFHPRYVAGDSGGSGMLGNVGKRSRFTPVIE